MEKLLHHLNLKLGDPSRFILGIAGAPASGKSTLASQLVESINELRDSEIAVLVPMDGYHKSNEELADLGILHLKGIPNSFDANNYVQLLSSIKSCPEEIHLAPEFRREIEASVQNAITVYPNHRLIVTEGNYLLLDNLPWKNLSQIIDEVWYLEIDENLRLKRLRERHQFHGRSEEETARKINETDEPNARMIEQSKKNAARILDPMT